MSASLVGSEMCIRDRPTPLGPSTHLFSDMHALIRMLTKSSSPFVISKEPVSYTHLTLPTICSV
eukprot:5622810-Alexandrium_andersonii.AAC.1